MGWLTSPCTPCGKSGCICNHYLISKWDLLRSHLSVPQIIEVSATGKGLFVASHCESLQENQ
jgi:hypothetical protein